MADLKERITVFTTDLTSASNEVSDLHRKLESQRSVFQQEQQANLDTIASLREIEAQVSSIRSTAQNDINEQIRRYNEANEKYQNELVSHADDVRALNVLRQQLDAAQTALNKASAQMETAQSNLGTSQASWETQKSALQKELDEQKKRSACESRLGKIDKC